MGSDKLHDQIAQVRSQLLHSQEAELQEFREQKRAIGLSIEAESRKRRDNRPNSSRTGDE